MTARLLVFLAMLTLLAGGCASTAPANGGEDPPVDPNTDTESDLWATRMYGDARVFYLVKQGAKGVAGASQKEIRYTLINRTHSLYRGLPDNQLRSDEYYISNADMMDLLNGLNKKCEFFDIAREIGSRDPFALAAAQSYAQTERFIAVEIIKNGVVNCAYLPRQPINDALLETLNEQEKQRLRHFGSAQEIVVFYTRYALPRGTSSTGRAPDIRRNPR